MVGGSMEKLKKNDVTTAPIEAFKETGDTSDPILLLSDAEVVRLLETLEQKAPKGYQFNYGTDESPMYLTISELKNAMILSWSGRFDGEATEATAVFLVRLMQSEIARLSAQIEIANGDGSIPVDT